MRIRLLKVCFYFAALMFVLFHFAENTVDPDLWGHVVFGQRMVASGSIEKAEPFSWTAEGYPWINHEVLAEVALGLAHQLGGGGGLLLLKMVIGLLTFGMALRIGLRGVPQAWRPVAWIVGLLATVEISFGFAARPQIFTAWALAVLLLLLRKIHDDQKKWALALPLLTCVWINTHGGVLAGVLIIFLAAGATMVQELYVRTRTASRAPSGVVPALWIAACASVAVLPLNPWGLELPRWLVGSVLWVRPEIQEWNPTPFGWDHGPFFLLLVVTLLSLLFSRKPKVLWEVAVVMLLAFMAVRHVRHTPLFSIAALAFIPVHTADLIERVRARADGLRGLVSRASSQFVLAAVLALLGLAMFWATISLHKNNAFTMEIPASQYPVAAVDFMERYNLHGNLLVYFDWGEMCIWELPDSRVSVDGRLDTSYPREVLKANWNFYNGWPEADDAMDINKADVALLPPWLAGAQWLAAQPDWKLVYADEVAAVFVNKPDRFQLLKMDAVEADMAPVDRAARVAFPDARSARAFID